MPALRSFEASWCEEDNSVHCITMLLSNLSFSDSDTSHSEQDEAGKEHQGLQEGVGQHVGGNYREQQDESDEDSLAGWDGGSESSFVSTDNSYLDPYEDVFKSTTVQPPPFLFLWLIVFSILQLFPWFTFYILVDACLKSLALLASFILLRVLVSYLEEGQLQEYLTYQRRHRLRLFYRIV